MKIVLTSPLDMHVHFRDHQMLKNVAPLTAKHFAGAVVMPNLVPPVNSIERLQWYTNEVKNATHGEAFEPFMTLFFRPYSREELEAAKPLIIGIKLYPAGATTNSDDGVQQIASIHGTLRLMEELEIPLLVHGESNGFVLDREKEFHVVYREIATQFPQLKIIMEHITTADSVALLDEFENLHATVTPHHLLITLDDVVGGLMNPHLFCKPIAKLPTDRAALIHAAITAHPKLMHGSDSAPHPVNAKECPGCAAGVFTAPIILPLLADLFENHNALDKLQDFISNNAQRIYNLTPRSTQVTLLKKPFTIPSSYSGVVPMWAGKTIGWQVESVSS